MCTGSITGALLSGLVGGGATPVAGAAALFDELARDLLAGSPFNLSSQESVQVRSHRVGRRWGTPCCRPARGAPGCFAAGSNGRHSLQNLQACVRGLLPPCPSSAHAALSPALLQLHAVLGSSA